MCSLTVVARPHVQLEIDKQSAVSLQRIAVPTPELRAKFRRTIQSLGVEHIEVSRAVMRTRDRGRERRKKEHAKVQQLHVQQQMKLLAMGLGRHKCEQITLQRKGHRRKRTSSNADAVVGVGYAPIYHTHQEDECYFEVD